MWQWSYGRQFLWPNECKRRSNDILRDAPAEIPAALLDHSTVLASWRQLHKNGLLKFGRVPTFPVTLLPRRVRSIIMNMSVCLSARISQKPHHTIVTELQEIFVRVACGRGSFFSDFIVINYILPYLWMTSSFHTMWLVTGIFLSGENVPAESAASIPNKFGQRYTFCVSYYIQYIGSGTQPRFKSWGNELGA